MKATCLSSSIKDGRFKDPEARSALDSLTVPILQGMDACDQVGDRVRELGIHRVLLVTDPGIVSAGHAARVRGALEAVGVEVGEFNEVRENPDTDDVDSCLAVAREFRPEAFVGLGGGSSLDTAKGCNFLLSNGGRMEDYWGREKARRPMLPLLAIPTTAGTGSECQRFALISKEETHQKMACGDAKVLARLAILDPGLTLTQPASVTACTGMDAFAHAIECAVTSIATPSSLALAREAFRWLDAYFLRVLEEPTDLAARSAMQWGAALGGAAIEHSMLGAAHSAANPLTAHYGVTHGQAVGLALPWVIRWNAADPSVARGYQALVQKTDPPIAEIDAASAAEWLAGRIEGLLQSAGLASPLRDFGVQEDRMEQLAVEAAAQWTAQFNPRPVAAGDFMQLYRGLWS
jgi:alcohol dehydrogenase